MRGTLVKEYKILSRLSHMNVIEVKEFIQTEDSLVLELCGIKLADKTVVDVKEWAMNIAKKTTKTQLNVMEQVVRGLFYLHENDVIHCDLKSSNCLVKENMDDPTVKVADFGVAYFQTVTHIETLNSQGCNGN